MSRSSQQTAMFWVLLVIFAASAVIALLSVTNVVALSPLYQKALFGSLILDSAAAIFAFWKQLSSTSLSDPPNVEGDDWEYECISSDEKTRYGGRCSIKVRPAAFGYGFDVNGERLWEADKVNGDWVRKDSLSKPTWKSYWGTFTAEDSLRYGYTLTSNNGTVEGHGEATVKAEKSGKVVRMSGSFYHLSPSNFCATQTFQRKSKDAH